MSLFYQHNINANTKLGIWKIEEAEDFFLQFVPLQTTISHPHKRLQHLAGRYLLKYLFPDFPHEEIVIADTKKPYLPYEQYHFSISHCDNYAAAIVSKTERVGIDIEIPTERVIRISNKFLNEKERYQFLVAPNSKPETGNQQLITVLWSAKEAVYKWWGWGGVDFSEHILLQPFTLANEEQIQATFIRDAKEFPLQLQYKLFNELCLVWLVSKT